MGPKRPYDSTRRRAQARQTQAHIAQAARDLFVERGYNATSVRDIAERAGVAVQTIYNAFDGKPAIMARVADIAVVGDDEPVALAERDEAVALERIEDPGELIDAWVRLASGIFTRFLPLLPPLREASSADAAVASMWRANAIDNRYAGSRKLAARLAEIGGLRDDMAVDRAADLMWSLASFDTAEALIVERGWSTEDWVQWMSRTLRGLLLGDRH